MTQLFFRSQNILIFVFLCLFNQLSAQTPSAHELAPSPVSVMGRQVNRVSDPLSQNTVWIDKYIAPPLTATEPKEGGIAHVVVFHFRVSSILFEPNYMDNARSLAVIDRIFADSTLFSNNKLAVIIGSASPEGYTNQNEQLANGRALATKKCIMDRHPHIDRDKISTYAVDEDWDGFRKMVMNDIYMPNRNQIIEILDSNLGGRQKLSALHELDGGSTYRYIKANIFPYLRGGVSCTFYITILR